MATASENEIGMVVVDAAISVHRELGPGLLESVYEAVLADELTERGLQVVRQVVVPIFYRGKQIDDGYRADIVANGLVVLELKSIEAIKDVHKKQLLTYLKLSGMKLGYLLNFGEAVMKKRHSSHRQRPAGRRLSPRTRRMPRSA